MNAELVWSLCTKGSIVLSLALLACLMLRHSSASRRHAVWLASLVALLIIPVVEMRLPSWNVPVARTPIMAPLAMPSSLQPVPASIIVKGGSTNKAAQFAVVPPEKPSLDWASKAWTVWLIGCF